MYGNTKIKSKHPLSERPKKRKKNFQGSQESRETQEITSGNQDQAIERKEQEHFKSLLFEEIRNKNAEAVKSLLENDKEVTAEIINQKVEERITFLLLAVGFNDIETAKLLLENGAEPELVDRSGKNCFHYAAKRGNLEMLKLLANYIKKSLIEVINTHDDFGLSILHDAATGIVNSATKKDENWAVIGWLLEQGADYSYKVKNHLWKDFSIEKILSQKDWSYAKNFQNIVKEFERKQKELELSNNKEKIFFQEIIKGKKEAIDKLNEGAKKRLKDFLELKEQLKVAKEGLIKEIGVEKIVEESEKSELVANLEVNPWGYLK